MPSSVEIHADYDLCFLGMHVATEGMELPKRYSPEALAELLSNFEGKKASPEVERVVSRLKEGAWLQEGIDEMNPAALVAAQCLQMAWLAWEARLSQMLKEEKV